uniref:CD80-like immunoglobulin C2-set domain-containing protein n=1 Tax=Cyprinus carpio TaxID=7962 RepID=A0A8C2EWN7_CYPCA
MWKNYHYFRHIFASFSINNIMKNLSLLISYHTVVWNAESEYHDLLNTHDIYQNTLNETAKIKTNSAFTSVYGKYYFNSASIEIKNATFEDEACYICSFKVYPFQPKRQTMCLTVKEITASVNPATNSDPDVVVSCSATGKPAPTILWKSAEKELNFGSNNFTTLNKDSSTTITSNITLPLSQFHGKYVECVTQSDGIEKSVHILVPDEDDKGKRFNMDIMNNGPRSYIVTVSVLIIMTVVVLVIIAICLYTKLKSKQLNPSIRLDEIG